MPNQVERTEVYSRVEGEIVVRVIHAVPSNRILGTFEVLGEIGGDWVAAGTESSRCRAVEVADAWIEKEIASIIEVTQDQHDQIETAWKICAPSGRRTTGAWSERFRQCASVILGRKLPDTFTLRIVPAN
ncbi:hypothetical protein ACUXAV_004903 [Cupriavidus metallidurans]|jgi:hypothetical protein|uniref:Uncharacterized protein n=2 Tax=Cupriavidus TaxID=106589 RepID=A0A3G8GVJ5_9BURK|nr:MULTISPECIES: hypothetical protein [Cupriavidus]AZG12010.1 hypothetical protein EHF44_00555 [Cupriavidus pauculus]MDE4922710.1 hypothetical protein [Cupriavidus metallidurans]MWL91673.1 hypothetical protein [Cupriavidus sp. SW-Y-13]QBP14486.1 hypothetical protein DDF84_032785 [Cupriavidus metallidurans]GMG94914.1 hypothetical protein Cmtc_61340 [Cupriavidus sp. TKC]